MSGKVFSALLRIRSYLRKLFFFFLEDAAVWAENFLDSKVHGAIMGSTWGRQDPGGLHVGHVLCYLGYYMLGHS